MLDPVSRALEGPGEGLPPGQASGLLRGGHGTTAVHLPERRGRPVPVSATSGDGRPVCLFSKCGDASGSGHTDRFAEVKNARRGTAKDMAQRTSDPVATRLRLRVARARLEVNRPLASPRDTELAAPAARLGSGVSLPQTAPVLRRHHEPRAATAGGRGPRRPQRRRHARAPSTGPLPPQPPGSGGEVRTP